MMLSIFSFFFFNDTATTEIYTLSLHDALPIFHWGNLCLKPMLGLIAGLASRNVLNLTGDRKSTRLNSSHLVISYAVFCLKKKKSGAEHLQCYILSSSHQAGGPRSHPGLGLLLG